MILRALAALFAIVVLGACTPQQALLASLIPDGTAGVVLGNLERVEDRNRRRIAELEKAGKWEELDRFALENIQKDSANADWWFVAGYARTQLNRHLAAAEAFSNATRLEPDNIVAWNHLGQAYRLGGDSRRAVNALNSALNMRRESPGTLYLLGESYNDLGRRNDALAAYRQAVSLEPQFAMAWHAMARTYADMGRREEAEGARAKLEKIDPKLAATLK